MDWKKAPKRKNKAVKIAVEDTHICIKCRSRLVKKDGDRCPSCMVKKERAKQALQDRDKAYREAYLKHKFHNEKKTE